MAINKKLTGLVLPAGLALVTLGMALVAFGVVATGLFFPGVYLLGIGLLTAAAGALLHVFGPPST